MTNLRCIACNNTKTNTVEASLEGDALDMFNFVCCLEISQADETQGICISCHDELRVSFNFKKRCLEIFANVYDHHVNENHNDDDFACLDTLLDQSLHEDDSLNLNDLLIPEVCLGNVSLSVLDVSDNTKCRYCFEEFPTKETCLEHMEIHKGDDKPYKCPQEGCVSSFKARKNLKDHYLVHSNERPFPCHFCEQTFKSSSNRSKHERRIHSLERNAMKSLNAEKQLNKTDEKLKTNLPLPAPVVVAVKEEMPATVTVINSILLGGDGDERIFKCLQDGCSSRFKSRSSLRDHQKVHSDERPYPCAFCSSAFKSSSNRSKHERGSHLKEYQKRKLERENMRNGEFNSESSPPKKLKFMPLQQASKVIIKTEATAAPKKPSVKGFPCRYCEKVLTRADNRDKHEATHKDYLAFDCGFCTMNFKTPEALKEHTKIHTDRKERRSASLQQHIKIETVQPEPEYICDEDDCGRTYTSPKALKNHKKTKHNDDENDEISCDICSHSFRKANTAEHLKIHI
ncbi:CLUMA_CG017962, isoform A [Clunio marinus]|uniref:CLUMA_CG017962, isoform A n=1 Tax=Clunio marinus TaxID=568069 RepID=A0A1J1J061_9DIPT|nr:CLUMA_CG017962, isoform A [Clunio marinus]